MTGNNKLFVFKAVFIFSTLSEDIGVNTKKISCFCTDGKISVRINLPLFSTVVNTCK